MNTIFRFLCASIALSVVLCACSPSRSPENNQPGVPGASGAFISDALGRQYRQVQIPERIISLSPSVTEILFAIGAGDKVVGVTEFCNYPPEAQMRTSIGGFAGATMSVEQIRALRADLVFLSADMHTRIVSLLDELGIPSFAVEPRSFADVYRTISIIGELTETSAQAETIVREMQKAITAVGDEIHGKTQPTVFWLLQKDPLMSVGGETFISEIISLAGGKNIFADLREQWALVSPEQVLLRKPDWILSGMGMEQNDLSSLHDDPLWRQFSAVQEGRVISLNGDIMHRYGPRLAEAVRIVAELIHSAL